jgi:hypothetical protein
LSAGAIAGIAIGAAAVALAAGVLLYLCGRRDASQGRRQEQQQYDGFPRPGTGQAPTMHSIPYSHHNSMHHASMAPYFDHAKHMSVQSSMVGGVGPALPGYMPQHDPNMSPPMHPAFPVSDSLNPGAPFALAAATPSPPPPPAGSDVAVASSNGPSPNQIYSAPVYGSGVPQNM